MIDEYIFRGLRASKLDFQFCVQHYIQVPKTLADLIMELTDAFDIPVVKVDSNRLYSEVVWF